MRSTILLSLVLGLGGTMVYCAAPPILPAFVPHTNLNPADFAGAKTFTPRDRLVATYYFYWYDSYTKAHLLNGDGTDALTDHPASLTDFSFNSVRWPKKEMGDMAAVGIDIAMPVFWGAPSEQPTNATMHWSYAGLKPMVQAREELLKEGRKAPALALFYDTSTLQFNSANLRVDLTTDYGRQWFYATIRDFFSMIPPKHWTMMNGQPLVLFYASDFATAHDQTCFDYVKQQFPKDFGGRVPYLVRQTSWRVKADATCAWGGALGLINPGVATLGPGYDHSAVPGRTPLIVKRRNGEFYTENWLKFLRRPSNLVTLETWNEFHEGTDICESKEYGRQYLDLTAKYVKLFKQGWMPPWPAGPYTKAKEVNIVLGEKNDEKGLRLVENEDGMTAAAQAGGQPARAAQTTKHAAKYLYFAADDSFKTRGAMNLTLEVEYFDAAAGTLGLEFDGSDLKAAFSGAYSPAPESVKLSGSKTWKTAVFTLPGARLLNTQNRGADLRLLVQTPEFYVRKVRLTR
jgi:hypothetical protein